ncbi:hypothetical protein BCR36DRAFT_465255 [Piromyces finnis]|uniref:Uncharacterized protein n=1 Tax=Piromyces finnis TaxID=1754191 RepID=A0A1Y1VHT4_9FUNG|nr:hypothetical protein BCR36DRAFT_465255 [Piromyces finnis]|eukprot:ORX56590.1 hypothetical protein BCR36DRAFT_465255 [Piromyces finnis]
MKLYLPFEISNLIYQYSHNIYFLCLFNNIDDGIVNDSINYYFLDNLKEKEKSNNFKNYLINGVKSFCVNVIRNLVYFDKLYLYKNTNINIEFINYNLYSRKYTTYTVYRFLKLNEKYGISTYIYEIINTYIFYYSVIYNKEIRRPLLVDKLVLKLYYDKYHILPKFVYCIPCDYQLI